MKKIITLNTLSIAIIVFLFASACNKYLDKKPDKQLVVPATLQDVQALFDQNNLMNESGSLTGEASADNYYLPQATYDALAAEQDKELYTWGRDIMARPPNAWSELYNVVYDANIGLETLDKIPRTAGNGQDWDNLKGSALFYRSYALQQVLFTWALAYDSLTADQDPGIPLRLNSDFNEPSVRSSVRESYRQLISDLKMAAGLLQPHPSFVTRPSKAAAYGLLARIFLSMRNYAEAGLYADDNNKIIPLVYRASEKAKLNKRVLQLQQEVGKKYSFEKIIGKSKGISEAVDLAKRVAVTDTTVLLLGETGTGKEVFAQAIHFASSRHDESFVALNCSAFSKELLESELFGYKEGAFTGAAKNKKGLFEEADKGTIFLDEIGEMAIELQAKLLRVLESGEFIKIGETTPTKVNVRVIAATNRDLEKEIEQGHFREDLYYRLSVFTISIPSLRERKKDIPLLAENFTQIFAAKSNKLPVKLSKEFLQALENYSWKGNIRELKNVIERSVLLCSDEYLTIKDLPAEIQNNTGTVKSLSAFSLSSSQKLHIQKVLNYTHGNKTEAARLLEISVATLYRKMEEYKIN